ncbi:pilus assembly protein [Robbsia sp. Bb-Pol-6]|uniref:Pilus assembly protein n=1 Tax=Robbsia betulipollinis TaxID=2981849 RepID=A0ABT3ZSG7_9BURK|nr:TadE/TadG family type IV pilus assembly protein [Robbsia betulipollinis]MCY0389481.1 pilus assembly protein [Robbsia betulipollinis]
MKGRWRQRLTAWSAVLHDSRGVTAIEFAVAAPFLLFMILGTIELGIDMIMDARVEYAAQSASRYGLTTVAPTTGTRADAAKLIVMKILGSWTNLPHTSVNIVETAYSSYGDVGSTNSTTGLGGLGDVVSYTVSLTTPGVSGIPQLLGMSTMTFQRNYIVQNEK